MAALGNVPLPARRALLVVLALFLAPAHAGPVWAGMADRGWTPAQNLSDTPGRSTDIATAVDPTSGDVFVAWMEDGIATWEEIVGRRWDHQVGGWRPAENLSQSAEWERDGRPELAFDGQGHGLLIWTRTYSAQQGAPADGYDVLWRAWDGAGWSPAQVLVHGVSYLPGSPGGFGLITVPRADSILLFMTWGTGYRTAEYQDGAWSDLAPWVYLDVSLAQVMEDEQGRLVAAAYGENSNQNGHNAWFRDAYYLVYDGQAWSPELNLSGTDGVADNVGLLFDAQGRLHFLWSDPDSSYSDESLRSAIWQRVCDGETWSPNMEVLPYHPHQAINGFAVTADVSSTLHLAWSEGVLVSGTHTGLDIYYTSGDGTAWEPAGSVYSSTVDSRYPAIVMNGDSAFVLWDTVFDAGEPLLDQEVYAARQADIPPPDVRLYLPVIFK